MLTANEEKNEIGEYVISRISQFISMHTGVKLQSWLDEAI